MYAKQEVHKLLGFVHHSRVCEWLTSAQLHQNGWGSAEPCGSLEVGRLGQSGRHWVQGKGFCLISTDAFEL